MPRKSHGRNQMLALVLSSVGGWSHKLVMMLTGEVGELPLRDMLLKAGGSARLLDCAAPSESWTAALLPDNLGAICSIFETRQQLAEADVNALHSALVCNDLYGQTYYGRVEYVNALYVGCVYANDLRITMPVWEIRASVLTMQELLDLHQFRAAVGSLDLTPVRPVQVEFLTCPCQCVWALVCVMTLMLHVCTLDCNV